MSVSSKKPSKSKPKNARANRKGRNIHGATSATRRSGKRAARTGDVALDRPFDRDILKRAEAIVRRYRIVLEHGEDGAWTGSTVELPNVFGDGQDPDECVRDTHEASVGAVAHMLELGQHPPESSARTLQVNIRLTPEEKLVLSSTARRFGFQGLSDFVRSAALDRVARTPS